MDGLHIQTFNIVGTYIHTYVYCCIGAIEMTIIIWQSLLGSKNWESFFYQNIKSNEAIVSYNSFLQYKSSMDRGTLF